MSIAGEQLGDVVPPAEDVHRSLKIRPRDRVFDLAHATRRLPR